MTPYNTIPLRHDDRPAIALTPQEVLARAERYVVWGGDAGADARFIGDIQRIAREKLWKTRLNGRDGRAFTSFRAYVTSELGLRCGYRDAGGAWIGDVVGLLHRLSATPWAMRPIIEALAEIATAEPVPGRRLRDSEASRRGRPLKLSEAQIQELKARLAAKQSWRSIARQMGISQSTISRYLRGANDAARSRRSADAMQARDIGQAIPAAAAE